MKALTSGEILEGSLKVFRSVAKLDDDNQLVVSFEGAIKIDNPYRYLSGYQDELTLILPQHSITSTILDFVKMQFCNDNGFYVLMDICDAVYNLVPGRVIVRRMAGDDWQHEMLPILLNLSEDRVAGRTSFENVMS